MEWRDDGLIIGVKRHGESSVILETMTREHGRHMGIVKGGRSRRMQPFLQPGNSVSLVWRARLEEHLGLYAVEVVRERAGAIMESGLALAGLNLVADWLRFLPERDPHEGIWRMAEALAEHLGDPGLAPPLMVRFELAVLGELGFGLDLDSCAATGQRTDLLYVSPRTGRAVSRDAGAPYAARLFALPPFLRALEARPEVEEVLSAFELTGHFLERDVLAPRGLPEPEARRTYLARLRSLP
ncbi:MAG: repair protein RecO [Hyphomicrobiales bacterium]|jgi:DNA repair protein RecO (recombination protein O)|nr:repair protein RecO [Hyphomicrobiales bacterium]